MERQEWWEESGRSETNQERLARALGWFSIGLGLAEVAAPGTLARLIGVRDDDEQRTVLRAMGVREIATGIGILSAPQQPSWMWGRVGGDAVDLALLGAAFRDDEADRGRLAAAIAAVAGVTVVDLVCSQQLARNEPRFEAHGFADRTGEAGRARAQRRSVRVREAITVNKPVEEVYAFWRDFENLPRFMRHLESVKKLSDTRSRWKARGPAGMSLEWVAEITGEQPNEHIGWRSLEQSDVDNRGSVSFRPAPGRRGTELKVEIEYTPPGGTIGRAIAWLFGEEPEQQMHEDLRRFKQLLETGEIPLSEGPGLRRPAQPAREPDELRTLAGVGR